MTAVIRGRFGKVILGDCRKFLNKIKHHDVCFTDPPFGKGWNGFVGKKRTLPSIPYNDNFLDYWKWVESWWELVKKKTSMQIIWCGLGNEKEWLTRWGGSLFFVVNKASCFGSRIGTFAWVRPLLMYGMPHQVYNANAIDVTSQWARARGNEHKKLIHPTPKLSVAIELLLSPLPVKTVLDPFMGSGATAESWEALGLNYTGFEINPAYGNDIKLRIKDGIKKHSKYNTTLCDYL